MHCAVVIQQQQLCWERLWEKEENWKGRKSRKSRNPMMTSTASFFLRIFLLLLLLLLFHFTTSAVLCGMVVKVARCKTVNIIDTQQYVFVSWCILLSEEYRYWYYITEQERRRKGEHHEKTRACNFWPRKSKKKARMHILRMCTHQARKKQVDLEVKPT